MPGQVFHFGVSQQKHPLQVSPWCSRYSHASRLQKPPSLLVRAQYEQASRRPGEKRQAVGRAGSIAFRFQVTAPVDQSLSSDVARAGRAEGLPADPLTPAQPHTTHSHIRMGLRQHQHGPHSTSLREQACSRGPPATAPWAQQFCLSKE